MYRYSVKVLEYSENTSNDTEKEKWFYTRLPQLDFAKYMMKYCIGLLMRILFTPLTCTYRAPESI